MNPVKQLARFTRDLLGYDEQLIKIGRDNWKQLDFKLGYIVIDNLVSQQISSSRQFDGALEQMTYTKEYKGDFTLNFFGDDALENLHMWVTLRSSQPSKDLQRQLDITVYEQTTTTDLKQLTGTDYNNRYELQVRIRYNITATVETLRIDTPQLEFLVDK